MNSLNCISDEEFLPFLQSLEVESDRKSFEWMFNDPELSGVLRWLYDSLDHSNALSAREKYRYAEIEKQLLSAEDLDAYILSLKEEFQGLCLPGDQEALQDAKMDVHMQTERLKLLEKQEAVIKDLIKQNELTKEELGHEITKLNSAQHQLTQDEASLAEECITLANEVESVTDGVIDVIADTLNLYGSAHVDKEVSKKFLAFGPFESYRQAQALYRSHFDLFVSRKFKKTHDVSDEDLRGALLEANVMGDRLSDAAHAYIDAKTALAGEQARLALTVNYQDVHPSRVAHLTIEEQAALDLEQEEPILLQQIQLAVKELVEARTKLAVETTARSALAVRERVHTDLTHLLDTTHIGLSLDRVLYYSLRAALRSAQDFIQLTSQLKEYYAAEGAAAAERIKSMNEICTEQESCENRLLSSDYLLETLHSILGVNCSNNGGVSLVRLYNELQAVTRELRDNVYDGHEKREQALVEFQKSTLPLRKYIWDGCTKLPNCWDTDVAAMTHSLKQQMEEVERLVAEASGLFSSVKNSDKQGLRKLWQWFLTDQNKLASAMRAAQTRSYS